MKGQTIIPAHTAIIMDGNGRWARQRKKNRTFGHKQGAENVRRIIKHSAKIGIKYLTLYAFSTENWQRPRGEVSTLMRMFSRLLDSEVNALDQNNVKINFIGRRTRISGTLLRKMADAEKKTAGNTGINLILAIDYGGRQEIIDAAKNACRDIVSCENMDAQTIEKYLYYPQLPDVDLLIRTADEKRISNFLLWQSAYAELYISPVCWPDFDETELDKAIEEYSQRDRKFGKIK